MYGGAMDNVDVPGPSWTHRFPVDQVRLRGVEMTLFAGNERLKSWSQYFGNIEPELLDWIDRMDDGGVFFDLGASIGHFSLYAALKRQVRVFCFEPEAQNFAALELNHFLNRSGLTHPLHSFNVALAREKAMEWVDIRHYGAGEHQKSLTSQTRDCSVAPTAGHRQSVLAFPLDALRAEFGLPQPHYVKIDVDGAERAVLDGARGTLAHAECKGLFIELDETGADTAATQELILQSGFTSRGRYPVRRGRGGTYEGLFNCVFGR
jgi:FkbM family methyltransferase